MVGVIQDRRIWAVARMGPDDVQTMLGWRAGKEPNRTGRFEA